MAVIERMFPRMFLKMAFALAFALSFLPSPVNARAIGCAGILMADLGKVGEKLVKYIVLMEKPCVFVQLQIPGGKGRYSFQKEICSFDGKSLTDDFSHAEFRRGEFIDDQLFFELAVMPVGKEEFEVKTCKVLFSDGKPDKLTCELSQG
ncbi:hypothetical protein ACIP1T_22015 [Pseudomonas japonica]|uniref:hypothetical protein n=1 Tax=Pseudomonas japonica TaxID=256466 RepID=UPI00381F8D28